MITGKHIIHRGTWSLLILVLFVTGLSPIFTLQAQGASLAVTFKPEEGKPTDYKKVYLNLYSYDREVQPQSHVTEEKEFEHTFKDLKPGRYMLMTSTFERAQILEPQPGLFIHHYQLELKEADEEHKVTIDYKHFDISTLKGDAVLEGTIQTADGDPVAGKKLKIAANVNNIGAILVGSVTTDDQGAFKLEGVGSDTELAYGVMDEKKGDYLGKAKLGEPAIIRLAPKVGMTAPDIDFVVLAGDEDEKHKLSDFAGKVVVLDFWATWCGPCQGPMAKMQTYAEKHPEWGDKAVLMSLSIDETRKKLVGHLEEKGWDKTTNAWVGDGAWESKAVQSYGVRGVPTCFIIDAEGKIAHTGHPASMDIPKLVSELVKKAKKEGGVS